MHKDDNHIRKDDNHMYKDAQQIRKDGRVLLKVEEPPQISSAVMSLNKI